MIDVATFKVIKNKGEFTLVIFYPDGVFNCYTALKALAEKHNGIHRKYICELYIARKRDAI